MPRKAKKKVERVRLTVEQKQEAREAFDLYDADGSGEIDELHGTVSGHRAAADGGRQKCQVAN